MKVVGIDAGGSKTRVIVGDREQLVSGKFDSHEFGPGSFREIGAHGVQELARQIRAQFNLTSTDNVRVIGGFSGAGTPESYKDVTAAFEAEGFVGDKVTITSDASLMLAALKNNGVLLISGTGSVCMGRKGGCDIQSSEGLFRAGGYGYRIGSEASGYYLGRRAIDVALKLEDGRRQEPSALYEIVKQHLGLDDLQKIAPILYPPPEQQHLVRTRLAALAPVVMEAAQSGDKVARQIMDEAVNSMADYIQAVCTKMEAKGCTVALHGGLFKSPLSSALILEPLAKHPYLSHLELSFETMGTGEGDIDALLEAVRFVLDNEHE